MKEYITLDENQRMGKKLNKRAVANWQIDYNAQILTTSNLQKRWNYIFRILCSLYSYTCMYIVKNRIANIRQESILSNTVLKKFNI